MSHWIKIVLLIFIMSFAACSSSSTGSSEDDDTNTGGNDTGDDDDDTGGDDDDDTGDDDDDTGGDDDDDTSGDDDDDTGDDDDDDDDDDTGDDDDDTGDDDDDTGDDDDDDDTGGEEIVEHLDRLKCEYETISEENGEFEGHITVGNFNENYVWNGYVFDIWSVDFLTTSQITYAMTDDFINVGYSQNGTVLSFDFASWNLFPLDTKIGFTIRGKIDGKIPFPTRCTPRYIRGDIIYPVYQDLPLSWHKGKEDIDKDDLIHNEDDYYKTEVDPIGESIFVYYPPHDTQILLSQPKSVSLQDLDGNELLINGIPEFRIHIMSEMMAMGIAFNLQWFKFNPNYFCGLGSKENYACLLVPKDSPVNVPGIPVTLDGEEYTWPIVWHEDGPFQQESPNFYEMARFFVDYFPNISDGTFQQLHDEYIEVPSDDYEDPKWATAAISSGLSSVTTRESIWAVCKQKYNKLVFESIDPWAELAVITVVYNQGFNGGPWLSVMTDIDNAINSNNVMKQYGLVGNMNHVPSVVGIVQAMNADVSNLYDAEITWDQIDIFLNKVVTKFYPRGSMSADDWQLVEDDAKRAFDVLKEHWGGDYISYRYDFLTILRVIYKHVPKPSVPRPTGPTWIPWINNKNCQ